MDPNTKLILDELHKGFSDSDLKWEQRLLDLEKRHDERVGRLESMAAAFDEWKPWIEASMEDVKVEVGKLSRLWDHPSATECPHAPAGSADGPDGHRNDYCHQEEGFGSVFVQISQSRVRAIPTRQFLLDRMAVRLIFLLVAHMTVFLLVARVVNCLS
jgi:hypothetical protein